MQNHEQPTWKLYGILDSSLLRNNKYFLQEFVVVELIKETLFTDPEVSAIGQCHDHIQFIIHSQPTDQIYKYLQYIRNDF
jgi:hypothetical protein